MEKGKAVRVYSINKEKLQEGIDAIEEELKSLQELLKIGNIHEGCETHQITQNQGLNGFMSVRTQESLTKGYFLKRRVDG